jgi:hypothetical protein
MRQPVQKPAATTPQAEVELTPADVAKQQAIGKIFNGKKEKIPKQPKVKKEKPPKQPKQPKQPKVAGTGGGGGSNTTRIILLAVLGVVLIGAAAYFFLFANKPPQSPFPGVPTATGQVGNNTGFVIHRPARSATAPGAPSVQKPGMVQGKQTPGTEKLPPIAAKAGKPVSAQAGTLVPVVKVKPAPKPSVTPQTRPSRRATETQARRPVPAATAAKPAVRQRPTTRAAKPAQRPAVTARPMPVPTPKPVYAYKKAPAKKTTRRTYAQKTYYTNKQAAPWKTDYKLKPTTQVAGVYGTSINIKRTSGSTDLYSIDETEKPYGGTDFYPWPGGQSAGKNKSMFDSPPPRHGTARAENEEIPDEFATSKKLYMVLIKESTNLEDLRWMRTRMNLPSVTPEIKEMNIWGRPVYWLTVGHYTTPEKAYNKAQEIKGMGYSTSVVSEKVHY